MHQASTASNSSLNTLW